MSLQPRSPAVLVASMLASVLLCSGCSTIQDARGGPGQKLDPWEHWNRKAFAFNEDLDRTVLKPVATTYADVVPRPVRKGVGNFFGNFLDAWSAVNNLLQGKVTPGFQDVVRVGTNTLFGLFGFVDVASEMGFDHQYEDFGQTLGHWGVGPGAYLVLPVLGPSTVRDAAALPLDRAVSPALLVSNSAAKIGIVTLNVINTRANLLGATRVIDEISLDKYTFIRDAYLQRRESLIYDGSVPDKPAPTGGGPSGAAGASGSRPAAAPESETDSEYAPPTEYAPPSGYAPATPYAPPVKQ